MDRLLTPLSVALLALYIFGAGFRWAKVGQFRDSHGRLTTDAALERIGIVIITSIITIGAISLYLHS